MQFQASLDDQTFSFDITDDGIVVDDKEVDVRVNRLSDHTLHLLVDNRSYVVTIERLDDRQMRVTHRGRTQVVHLKNEQDLLLERLGISTEGASQAAELRAPMPGLVLQVLVEPGQEVKEGDGLVVLEAMKMENELRATASGTIAAVHVAPGKPVVKNDLLVSFGEG